MVGEALTVQYHAAALRAGDWVLPVRLAAFDDPALLPMMQETSDVGRLRLLWFLLEPSCHGDLRALLKAATGTSTRENVTSFVRVILEQEAMNLLVFLGMLSECPDELTADFRRFYTCRLEDALTEESPRTLGAWAVSLPREGAVHRKLNPESEWDLTPQLLAGILDVLNMRRFEAAKLAGAKAATQPKPLERPGVKSADTETVGASEGFDTVEEFQSAYAEAKALARARAAAK